MNQEEAIRLKAFLIKLRDEVLVNHDLNSVFDQHIAVLDVDASPDLPILEVKKSDERRKEERDPYEHEQHEAAKMGMPVMEAENEKEAAETEEKRKGKWFK